VPERLPAIGGREPDAVRLHPLQRLSAVVDELAGEFGIAPVLRDTRERVQEVAGGVRAEVRMCQVVFGQRADEVMDVGGVVVDGSHQAGSEGGVASSEVLGCPLEQVHVGPRLPGGDGRTQARVTTADHDDLGHVFTPHV